MTNLRTPLSSVKWRADPSCKGTALAEYLAKQLLISREEASDLIDFGSVQIGVHREQNPRRSLEGGEEIQVNWPWGGVRRVYEIDPNRILYKDSYLLAYDKEAGIPSQQTPSDAYNNLFAALYRNMKAAGSGKSTYVALHHRLDKETSGVMLFSLDSSVNRKIGSAFEHHRVTKDYLAWVSGTPSFESRIACEDICRRNGRYATCPHGQGKHAETLLKVLHRNEDRSLVWARPKTGRTHQIRLHLSTAGHPVLGDRLYGRGQSERLYLHAYRLQLAHPVSGSVLTLTAPVPADWPHPRAITIPD